MENSSLLEILRSFSKEEMKRFTRFVESPYFNTSEATAKLIAEIAKYHPEFESKNLSKEKLFEKVYGSNKFSDNLIRKLVSNLINLSEKFLTVENPNMAEHNLLNSLRKKKLYKQYLKHFDRITKSKNDTIINEDVFLFSSLYETEQSNYLHQNDRYIEYEESLLRVFNYDTLYYFYRLAQTFIRAKHTSAFNPNNKEDLILHTVNAVDLANMKKKLKEIDFIHKGYLLHFIDLILLELTNDESLYLEIKQFTFNYPETTGDSSVYLGYIYLFEFISRRVAEGKEQYIFERFEIYKHLEKYSYSNNPEQITLIQLNNFFFSGIATKNIDFSEYLLNKYVPLLESRGNPGLNKFFRAWILFEKGQFKESLKLISVFSTGGYTMEDQAFAPHARRLILQLNYELGYYDEALYYLDSFTRFMKNNKKTDIKQKSGLGKFIKVYSQLLDYRLKHKHFNPEAAKKSININFSFGRNWLIEKIDEINSA